MTHNRRAKNPALVEMVVKKMKRKVREGRPFALAEVIDKELIEFAEACCPNPEDRYGKNIHDYVTVLLNNQLRRVSIRDTMFKRYNRATETTERKFGSTVIYPSNDRDRYHLSDSEVFIPAWIRKSDPAWKEYGEYPVRVGQVEPEPIEQPEAVSVEETEEVPEIKLPVTVPDTIPESLVNDILNAGTDELTRELLALSLARVEVAQKILDSTLRELLGSASALLTLK